MVDIIIIMALALICTLIIKYLYKEHKSGHCIGCSAGKCGCVGSCENARKEMEALQKIRDINSKSK